MGWPKKQPSSDECAGRRRSPEKAVIVSGMKVTPSPFFSLWLDSSNFESFSSSIHSKNQTRKWINPWDWQRTRFMPFEWKICDPVLILFFSCSVLKFILVSKFGPWHFKILEIRIPFQCTDTIMIFLH